MISVICIIFTLTACSVNNISSSDETLIFADAGWDSIRIHNAIARFIIEEGYGYKTDEMTGSSSITLQGLIQGDIDVYMEAWVDNYKEIYTSGIESGDIVELSVNFDDNTQGLYVPTYVIEGDPERGIKASAPELKSIKDLPEYWEVFKDPDIPKKGRIYGSPPNWAADEILRKKFETYGLSEKFEYFNPGSDTALNTSIVSAIEKGEPWVGYYWEPTWIMGKYDMTLLEDEPYSLEKWENGYACEFPGVKVTVAVNKEVTEKAPEVVGFLKNYKTSSELTNKMLAYMQENDVNATEAAMWFLREYEDLWAQWLPDDIANKVKKSL
ncbi:ABC transporter substrate-binding protein [Tepidanaerobacter acetatoxydans]|uniref:ABC transporter substrate-binding protein n=1 Tax=Tepidanaerobacter acetatoxydans TaxID=499229 RepID=UPI00235B6C90|nr:ABC transporter substrate-binding protein [Tepidanaerobacter acetatoxydans]